MAAALHLVGGGISRAPAGPDTGLSVGRVAPAWGERPGVAATGGGPARATGDLHEQSSDIPATVRAMKAGASEFLTKPLAEEVTVTALGAALEASRTALRRGARVQAIADGYQLLSLREREVMQLLVAGRLNKQ